MKFFLTVAQLFTGVVSYDAADYRVYVDDKPCVFAKVDTAKRVWNLRSEDTAPKFEPGRKP